MKKQRCFCFGISILILGMTGCTTGDSQLTPTPTIEERKQEATFQRREESSSKELEVSNKITKTEGLCEVVEPVEDVIIGYNTFNRKASPMGNIGMAGTSLFCVEESSGVIYFVNQGNDKDCFLYRIKEGEVALAVEMPVKEIYPYGGSIYFMVDDYKKYELQEMQSGDIYCYTPESGTVELVYSAGAIESSEDHKLYVEDSGIYFSYSIKKENNLSYSYDYYLPFGELEPIKDTRSMTTKGSGNYYLLCTPKLTLVSRTMQEDGTREELELSSIGSFKYCVQGEMLYSIEKTSISCTNLETKETIYYDFTEAIKKKHGENVVKESSTQRVIDCFTMTEDALWITSGTGNYLYRMDLKSGEVTFADIYYNNTEYRITTLYTDGTELYGVYSEKADINNTKKNIVHIITDTMGNLGSPKVQVEDLIKK